MHLWPTMLMLQQLCPSSKFHKILHHFRKPDIVKYKPLLLSYKTRHKRDTIQHHFKDGSSPQEQTSIWSHLKGTAFQPVHFKPHFLRPSHWIQGYFVECNLVFSAEHTFYLNPIECNLFSSIRLVHEAFQVDWAWSSCLFFNTIDFCEY